MKSKKRRPSASRRGFCAASILTAAVAASLSAQTLVLDEPLTGSTTGTQSGGMFLSDGWKVTGHTNSIYWHIPTLSHGAVEWDMRGLNPNEDRAGMRDKAEIFHMYDWSFGNADTDYNGGYRDDPYKHFVRKIGTLGGTTNAMELVWQISPNFQEPDTPVLSWSPSTTYRFREEWGPDGAGNSVLRTYRDSTLLRTTSVPGSWTPGGHSVRLAASPRAAIAPDGGAPIDAVYSNLKVWDFSIDEPPPPMPTPRTGEVSLNNHALHDDQGDFNGLGVSYFQALRRTKYDRARYRSDLDFLARRGFNYIRTLSMVGWYPAWDGKEIAPVTFQDQQGNTIPAWSDYWQQLRDMIDIAYDEFGIRTELTIFADAQLMPDKNDRIAHMASVLEAIEGREDKVILLEVANEAWQNGFPEQQGIADLREFGQYLGERTDVLVALSATPEMTNESLAEMYVGSAADIATEHFSRDIGTVEGGWLPVREPYRVNSIANLPPASHNEPIGPGSSVASQSDPIKLVSAAAYAYMSGLPMYVYHTSAGVFGNVRFEDMAGVSDYQHLDDILPGDIANWQRSEGADPFTPFITYADGQPNLPWTSVPGATTGVIRHLSNVRDNEFYTLPIAILAGGVELEPRQDMTMQVFNPLTGEVVQEMTPSAGQRFTLAQGPQAYIIRGSYDDGGDARINLDRVNDPHGLVHPNTGDGNTVPATIGGRDARRNDDPSSDFYMYFAAADWFAYQGDHPELYITVEYFDDGTGPLSLQYDSNTGTTLPAFYKSGGSVQRGDTDTWKSHTFHITDAYFGNRENYGSDFRIGGGVGSTFYLDSVTVALLPPGSQWINNASGNWHNSSNWSGGVPNAIGSAAQFLSVITADRTITLDAAATVGTLRFANANSYKIDGSPTLKLQVSSGQALVQVLSGMHEIAAPLLFASDTNIVVSGGSELVLSDPVTVAAGKSVTQSGSGSVSYQSSVTLNINSDIEFANPSHLTGLTMAIGSGASVLSGAEALRTNSLVMAGTAKIDLHDNDLIVDGGSYSTIEAKVKQGFNSGDWLGAGITSSTAANDSGFATALAVVNNAETGYTSFAGFTGLNGDEILVKHTYYGDADANGAVNLDDFDQFLFGYNNGAGGPPAIWLNGDFDYNGSVNLDDFNQFLFGLQNQGDPQVSPELFAALTEFAHGQGVDVDLSTVPEPCSALLALGGTLFLRRSRSRHF